MGRERLSASITVRLTPEERRALEQMAAQEQRRVSDMVRLAIREAARTRGLWPENGEEFEG
jgi:uncharacterized protein (DUF1778 family)